MRCDSAAARLSYYIPHIRRIVSVALESLKIDNCGSIISICGALEFSKPSNLPLTLGNA